MSYFPFASTGEAGIDARRGGPAGDARPAHSQVAVAGTLARVGDHQPHSTDVAGRLPDRARVPLSRALSIREARLGDVLLAHDRKQSHREVLRPHGGGKAVAR